MDKAEMAEDTDNLVASTSFSNELSSVPEEPWEEQPSEKQETSAYDTDCHWANQPTAYLVLQLFKVDMESCITSKG